ncbi:MAG: DUF1559 domain-containing protein [Planctomycetia bacterium]|nr:DUF1559 domain-containing protein [Planctomycetia bacterium]
MPNPWDRDRRDEDDDDEDDRPRPRRSRRSDEDDYYDRPRRQPTNGLASTALVLGLISLCMGPLLGVPALICGVIALSRPGGRGGAVAGVITGGIGTLVTPFLLIALLLPAVHKVRDSAARMQDSNNLKQIAIGVHNYHDNNNKLPPATPEGRLRPATGDLSWRVHLLPYVEQSALYKQFNTNQAWDSPTNRPHSQVRVPVFVSAADPVGTTETRYRVFVGSGTLYDPVKPVKNFTDVPDGLGSTFFAVETRDTVPWSQPNELQYDRDGSLPQLGHEHRKGFQVIMLDGSVRFISEKTSPDAIKGGIDPRDGRHFIPD